MTAFEDRAEAPLGLKGADYRACRNFGPLLS